MTPTELKQALHILKTELGPHATIFMAESLMSLVEAEVNGKTIICTDIAEETGGHRTAVSGHHIKLSDDHRNGKYGLVSRTIDPKDTRSHLLTLTEKGWDLMKRLRLQMPIRDPKKSAA